ncbi:Hypothetical predicted protein, partial [Xyrichtys novacula]
FKSSIAQEMTLQELLKNDEDKRSDQGGKSGERLAGWRQHEVAAVAVSRRGDMFIKARVTSLNQCIRQQEDWSAASNTDLIIGVSPAKIHH